jgi:acyl-CoA reductase-like NAD-dependent aldehyde dehydrogenase
MTDEPFQLVIGGRTVPGAEGTYAVTNPARPGEVVLEAPSASHDQLDQAVGAARAAQPAWAALDDGERAAMVIAAAEAAGRAVESENLATLLTREHGKVLWEAMFDAGTVGAMAASFAPVAASANEPRAREVPGKRTEVRRVPHGVVAALLPFNWPVAVMGNKVVPALLTGNAVVVKAPPSCPGAVLRSVAAMAALLPDGVLNVLNGPHAALGAALVAHPGVDMVSFTGGVPTGQAVMAAASAATKPVVLELGGNDPAILAPDVIIDEALADKIVGATFVTSGQVCMAIKRLYVPEERTSEVVEALSARLSAEVVGDGLAEGVTMGPVHLEASAARVEAMLEEAEQLGAKVSRPAQVREGDLAQGGYFVPPALVDNPPVTSRIVTEEQFAPALPVLGYRDLDQAVAMANDTEFGLCASIWSNDDELASSVARRLEAGTVFVNAHGMSAMDPSAPMGGWKSSGFGVELGPEGMRAFTRPQVLLTHPGPSAS